MVKYTWGASTYSIDRVDPLVNEPIFARERVSISWWTSSSSEMRMPILDLIPYRPA